MIAIGSGYLAAQVNQQSHPDGHCPELPEPLLTRLFGYATATGQAHAIPAQLDAPDPGEPAAQQVPGFTQSRAIPGYSAQISISLSRNRALFSIPPPLT